jgi:integrase
MVILNVFWLSCENARLADKTGVGNALSKMDSGGAPLEMIGRLLGHTQIGTTQRYAHLINSGWG